MMISRNTVDKLGVNMYGSVSDVLAEIISNSYDADAEHVSVSVPAGEMLAARRGDGSAADRGFEIAVEDDGHGMTPAEACGLYLRVGADRRTDARRGRAAAESRARRRPVMGRGGTGKLAPFSICKRIEVRSAGGDKKDGGYATSHFAMRYDDITGDTDVVYRPEAGGLDGKASTRRGTLVTLSDFLPRRVPDMDTLMRQLAAKFSLGRPDFRVTVRDTVACESAELGGMGIETEPGTRIDLDEVVDPGGLGLPVRGWVAYSRHPYRNEEMAGVRIYARGRLAAVTRDFGRGVGFTGEHSMRSYLVGELHAEWLDGEDDLVAGGRRDIMWSSDKCEAFREWGRELVGELGRHAEAPVREAAYREFDKKSGFEAAARGRFGDAGVLAHAIDMGRALGRAADREMLGGGGFADGLRDVALAAAPGGMAADRLAQVADEADPASLGAISTLLGEARMAEMASVEPVAAARVRAIEKLESAIRGTPDPDELELLKILEAAPWLIDPRWTILQSNRTLANFRSAFESWCAEGRSGAFVTTTAPCRAGTRPDFVLVSASGTAEIVEIKKPGHALDKGGLDKACEHMDALEKFAADSRCKAFGVTGCHMTLICDKVDLSGIFDSAFRYMVEHGELACKTWAELLAEARGVHEDFVSRRNEPAGIGGPR